MGCKNYLRCVSWFFWFLLGFFKYRRIFGSEMKMSCINGGTCGAQKLNCYSNLHGSNTCRSTLRLILFSEQDKWFFFRSVPRIMHKTKCNLHSNLKSYATCKAHFYSNYAIKYQDFILKGKISSDHQINISKTF